MKIDFQKIGQLFRLEGNVISYTKLNDGLVNKTYIVTYNTSKSYIFQEVNTKVFKDPVKIMKNIDAVTEHVRNKGIRGLHFHHTENRDNYAYISENSFWRVVNYIPSVTFNTCEDLHIIESVGKTIADFQTKLQDLDINKLYETIPDFHNTEKRINTLLENHKDVVNMPELEFIKLYKDEASYLSRQYNLGNIPHKVTHNDTKANNILFDKDTLEPIVLIDLDTVMPGMAIYDFADSVRFICNDAKEDDNDSLVNFNLEKFDALCKGYLPLAKNALSKIELDNVVASIFAITIELASRFLDDYLNGNIYFKCDYKEHNLVRARNQIALAKDIISKKEEMENIIKKYI